MMDLNQMGQVVYDYWRPNHRGLKKYILNDGKKHPVAIICPGGGYSMVCSYVEGVPFARELNRMGYSAVVVYYRCKKKARFPAPMDDLAWAVREVLDHAERWNLDVSAYSVWGSSAGGHLAASFGTESLGYTRYGLPKPGAIVLSYPVITMTIITHGGSRKNLLGDHPTEEEIGITSIEQQVTKEYPPTFVWYGDEDAMVPTENSQMLSDALARNGIIHQLHHYPKTGHGVGLGKGLPCEGWFQKAIDFWEQNRRTK